MIKISIPNISEIIKKEFVDPFYSSISVLSKATDIREKTLNNIINDKEKITKGISMKLGRFFGVSDDYFINIQNEIERRNSGEK